MTIPLICGYNSTKPVKLSEDSSARLPAFLHGKSNIGGLARSVNGQPTVGGLQLG